MMMTTTQPNQWDLTNGTRSCAQGFLWIILWQNASWPSKCSSCYCPSYRDEHAEIRRLKYLISGHTAKQLCGLPWAHVLHSMSYFTGNYCLIHSFAFLGIMANSLISCPLEMLTYTMISQKHNKNNKERACPVVLHVGGPQRPGLCWAEDVHTTPSMRGLFLDLKSIRHIPPPCQGDTLQPPLFN